MNNIKLFWYKLNEGHGNFGDEVNPYLIEKLTGKNVEYSAPFNSSRWISAKSVLLLIVKERKPLKEVIKFGSWNRLFNRPLVFAIGSIIRYADTNVKVWGSGIISRNENIPKAEFLAVRGKYTQQRLKELGHSAPNILGDPAILLPLVFSEKQVKKFKVGIIPHHFQFAFFSEKFSNTDIPVIDLLQKVEKVIMDIQSCEMTLCTSLHGIIVSHAYGIPSLWIDPMGEVKRLSGDDIKFADYFSSLLLKEYLPIKLDTADLENFDNYCQDLLNEHKEYALPLADAIIKVRKGLLEVAPFKILKRYME